jgi:predicted porin
MYTTPTFAGLNATAYFSPNAQEAVQNNTTSDTDGQIWGATVRGRFGAFLGQIDYVITQGNSPIGVGAGAQVETEAWKAGAAWQYMPGASIGLTWTGAESNQVAGLALGDTARQQAWTLNWEHTFGNIQVMAQYGLLQGLKDCDSATLTLSCDGTKADGYMVGARYLFSKRTWMYASWNMVDNEGNQFADYRSAGYTSVGSGTIPYGADPQIWALGLFHAF